jgi:hypothetical protein
MIEMDERFSKANFLAADDGARAQLMQVLQDQLSPRLRDSSNFHVTARHIVDELRALGHDLWSFDESDDFEVWAPNYQTPTGPGLVITFSPEDACIEWNAR